jgi:hypothetical protein
MNRQEAGERVLGGANYERVDTMLNSNAFRPAAIALLHAIKENLEGREPERRGETKRERKTRLERERDDLTEREKRSAGWARVMEARAERHERERAQRLAATAALRAGSPGLEVVGEGAWLG